MKGCNQKIKDTCGDLKNYAACVYYEGELGVNTELDDIDCNTVEEVIEDIYDQLDDIYNQTNLSALGTACLEYVEVEGKLFVKNVLLKFEQEICDLKTQIATLQTTDLCNRDITECVDTTGLVDACDTQITTLGQLLQYLVTNSPTP